MNGPIGEVSGMIERAVKQEIQFVVDQEIAATQARIADKVRGSIGSIAAKVLQNFTYEQVRTDLVITVKFAFGEGSK